MRVIATKQSLAAEIIVTNIKNIVKSHLATIEFLLTKIIVLTIKAIATKLLLIQRIQRLPIIQRQALDTVKQAAVVRLFPIRKVIVIITAILALLIVVIRELAQVKVIVLAIKQITVLIALPKFRVIKLIATLI